MKLVCGSIIQIPTDGEHVFDSAIAQYTTEFTCCAVNTPVYWAVMALSFDVSALLFPLAVELLTLLKFPIFLDLFEEIAVG